MAFITSVDTGASLKLPADAAKPTVELRFSRRALILGGLGLATGQILNGGLLGFNIGRFIEKHFSPKKNETLSPLSATLVNNAKAGDVLIYPANVYYKGTFGYSTYTYSEPNSSSKKLFQDLTAYPEDAINNPDRTGQPIVIVKGQDEFNYYRIPMHTQPEAVRKQFGGLDYVYINVNKGDENYKLVNPEGPNKVAK